MLRKPLVVIVLATKNGMSLLMAARLVRHGYQSTNGIFLNDKKTLNAALKNNDQILIGQHTLVFVNPEEQAAASAGPSSMDSDATVIMTPQRQQQILNQTPAPSAPQTVSSSSPAPAKPAPSTTILG